MNIEGISKKYDEVQLDIDKADIRNSEVAISSLKRIVNATSEMDKLTFEFYKNARDDEYVRAKNMSSILHIRFNDFINKYARSYTDDKEAMEALPKL